VAVVLSGSDDFTANTITAYGGLPGSTGADGTAGTIYLKGVSDSNGTLIVDSNGQFPWYGHTTPAPAGTHAFDSVVTSNNGVLEFSGSAVLEVTSGTPLVTDSTPGNVTSRVVFNQQSNLSFPAAYTLTGVLSQKGTNAIAYSLNLTVATNGILKSESGIVLELTLNGSLTVDDGGVIGGIGLGFGSNSGPGAPSGNDAGGAHGGKGGRENATDNTYGLILTPDTAGSGGRGNSGGGVVLLDINGAVTNNGAIQADGRAGDHGCGAGGSIDLSATTLAGSGTISANGGTDTFARGSGGGGRVAIRLSAGNDVGGNVVTAQGGDDIYGTDGGAGTYYLEKATDGSGGGTIAIDNGGGGNTTHLPGTLSVSEVLDAAVLDIKGNASVVMTADETVGDVFVSADSDLNLGTFDLTVKTSEHTLDGTVNTSGGQILWLQPTAGTVVTIR